MKSEQLKGHLDPLVLAVLEAGPRHGYGIIEQLRLRSDAVFDLPEGTVYPALRRLERDGIVEGHWVEIGAGSPRRRYYRLTFKGERALAEGREEWRQFRSAADSVLGPV